MDPIEIERIQALEHQHWWYQSLQSLLLQKPGTQILDLGCGTGANLKKFLQDRKCEVVGVDPNPLSAQICAQKSIPHQQVSMQNFLSRGNGKEFDLVIAMDSFYFLSFEELGLCLRQIWEITSPGGLICIQLPALNIFSRGHDQTVGIKNRTTKREMRKLLRELALPAARISLRYRVQALSLGILISKGKFWLSRAPTSDLFPLPPALNGALRAWQTFEDRLPALWGSSLWIEIRKGA